jgi:hypothetical protein
LSITITMKEIKCDQNQSVRKYMPIKDAAYYFGFAEQTIRNWINQNKLLRDRHYLKVGRSIRIHVPNFEQWMLEQSNPMIAVGGK